MRHGSLFTGIGGFDLAASWMGWDNVFQVELSPFCNRVLQHYFPGADRHIDIRNFNGNNYHGTIDIISGGFPCQPFSVAGKRRGREDDRFLWPQAVRVIKSVRPRWIVLENVAGLLSVLEPESLSDMEIKAAQLFSSGKLHGTADKTVLRIQRRIIGTILTDIRAAGYYLPSLSDGTPVILCIPACAQGAPHRRDRLWIVAHTDSDREGRIPGQVDAAQPGQTTVFQYGIDGSTASSPDTRPQSDPDTDSHRQHRGYRQDEECGDESGEYARHDPEPDHRYATDTNGSGLKGQRNGEWPDTKGRQPAPRPATHPRPDWTTWPAQPPFCGRNDGLSTRLDNISFSKWRKESIHAFGNAIVPQVAFTIFQAIAEADRIHDKTNQ